MSRSEIETSQLAAKWSAFETNKTFVPRPDRELTFRFDENGRIIEAIRYTDMKLFGTELVYFPSVTNEFAYDKEGKVLSKIRRSYEGENSGKIISAALYLYTDHGNLIESKQFEYQWQKVESDWEKIVPQLARECHIDTFRWGYFDKTTKRWKGVTYMPDEFIDRSGTWIQAIADRYPHLVTPLSQYVSRRETIDPNFHASIFIPTFLSDSAIEQACQDSETKRWLNDISLTQDIA